MSQEHIKPFIPHTQSPSELTFKAIFLGIILSLFFNVANTYLGLRVGMTISASIPSAVLSLAILGSISRKTSILEHNIVQTMGSVGEGLAGGVIFTIPALFLLGSNISNSKIFLLSFLGGILGILFMIPMRRYLIVKEHATLPYPEGTACAEILKSGTSDEKSWVLTVWGIIISAIYKMGTGIANLLSELIAVPLSALSSQLRLDGTPALLGVGMIIGPRIAATLFAGGALAWWIFIPLMKMFAAMGTGEEAGKVLAMTPIEIWSHYIRYIGVGAIAMGSIYNLIKILPILINPIKIGIKELFSKEKQSHGIHRTDKDIPMKWLIIGPLTIAAILWLTPSLQLNLLSVILILILGYFFAAVTSIMCGMVGSSSTPGSGMIITSLLISGGLFSLLGWNTEQYVLVTITLGSVVSTAIALAMATSQDLKTGFLLGATPYRQQISEMFALVLPCVVSGFVLVLLNNTYHFGSISLPAPQATLMSIIAKGIIEHQLPTLLVLLGAILGLLMILLKVNSLSFALGIYLPLETNAVLFIGGIIGHFLLKYKGEDFKKETILMASGLVAGDACMSVFIALLAALSLLPTYAPILGIVGSLISFLIFCALIPLITLSVKTKKIN